MNEQELRVFFSELVSMLRQMGLGWILRQLVSNSAEMDDEEVETYLIDGRDTRSNLLSLLDALEIVLVETVQMEGEIRNFFTNESEMKNAYERILDIPESETGFVVNRLAPRHRQEASLSIQTMIETTRGLIG